MLPVDKALELNNDRLAFKAGGEGGVDDISIVIGHYGFSPLIYMYRSKLHDTQIYVTSPTYPFSLGTAHLGQNKQQHQ